ncbi:hypothetical protein P280DRAFT_465320 [Massarina eburnea CBS 473.64]|uniref:Beta-glucuronidase C-terminal domain-containing protein n=1 Tax=Massarina eburnea CBS 473.64 TaxID=1395130 RepID=A0A6A6SD75_9PLEO|nr:hypothetical protein P280DRAFT_465320 [Massarina eburnea CBS 473.64]
MIPSLPWTVLHSLAVLAPLSLAQSTSFTIQPKRAGAAVSDNMSPSFAGFGIEPSNLFSFTGNDNTNTFSIQLLQNLADYSGAPPHIRLGGNTADYMLFDSTYKDFGWKDNPKSTAQGAIAADSMIIGPNYFAAVERFPKGTWVTFGLNLAYQGSDSKQRMVDMAQAAVDGLKNTQLYSFEIGNEPDLWLQNGFRTGAWNGEAYTTAFMDSADNVYQNVLKSAGLPATFFEPPATASTIGNTFEITQLVNSGLLDEKNGNYYVGWWNQHDYFQFIGVTSEPITLDNLMDLDATDTQFAYWAKQVKVAIGTGVPYVLREMSSIGPIGMHGVSDTFGAALWTLNFFLYTATMNVSSVQMHMTDNSNASAWQPITVNGQKPFVRPQYYAHAAVHQIIGNGNGTTQLGQLDTSKVSGDYKGRIRAYTAYANGNIQSAILINSKPSTQNSYAFNLNFGAENKGKTIYLSYLTADAADSFSGTTWNGMQFDDTTGNASIVDDSLNTQTLSDSGQVTISVRDSQAIVANLDWQLGSNEVLLQDGTTTSGSRRKNSAATSTRGSRVAVWMGVVLMGFICFA